MACQTVRFVRSSSVCERSWEKVHKPLEENGSSTWGNAPGGSARILETDINQTTFWIAIKYEYASEHEYIFLLNDGTRNMGQKGRNTAIRACMCINRTTFALRRNICGTVRSVMTLLKRFDIKCPCTNWRSDRHLTYRAKATRSKLSRRIYFYRCGSLQCVCRRVFWNGKSRTPASAPDTPSLCIDIHLAPAWTASADQSTETLRADKARFELESVPMSLWLNTLNCKHILSYLLYLEILLISYPHTLHHSDLLQVTTCVFQKFKRYRNRFGD